jgi:hypothetical protein
VFDLSSVGIDIVTGLIPRPRNHTDCPHDPYIQINSDGKQARRPNTKGRRRTIIIIRRRIRRKG